jgi:RNA polymerase sigma factor (TIGR02999 family)
VPNQDQQELTKALAALRDGAPAAMDQLIPLIYTELRRMAHWRLGGEPTGHTLTTTAVVHETYLRLAKQTHMQCVDRDQFFAVAARAMRHILVDYARRHRAARRGGAHRRMIALDALEVASAPEIMVAEQADSLVALDEALARLAVMNERLARVVECRFFGGLTEGETAASLGISQRTVAREWALARAWLNRELQE